MMTPLAGWENFYVIVGSSAGALIGLQFVVITLIANTPIVPGQALAGDAFATPTIVHFCVVLLVAAIQSAPWHRIGQVAAIWGVLGVVGIVYEIIVARRMRVQTAYSPVFEDWLFHFLLPLVTYTTMVAAAFVAVLNAGDSLLVMAAAVLALLFIGIHNAWDAVTYHVFSRTKTE
ncbi:MAG: hypothetical protein ACRD8A_18490 [Candidatus Acidiferrales bacterium]